METSIGVAELRPGDVLLYRGRSAIAELIRLFDGSEYNHAGIFDGRNVAEALIDGVVSHSVRKSAEGMEYVDVYRFRAVDGHVLGDPGYEAAPVIDRTKHYVANGERFAYEEILLLAVLCATRQVPLPGGMAKMLRTLLDHALEVLSRMMANGKQPMICSELVYRCYEEAGNQYDLVIVGADQLTRMSAYDQLTQPTRSAATDGHLDEDQRQCLASAETFLRRLAAAKKSTAHLLAVPDFVTPRDLKTCQTLYRAGRLLV